MTKTLSSVTLLLLASGWLSILPAQTQKKYVCTRCGMQFDTHPRTKRCPKGLWGNAWDTPHAHEIITR